jgi:hypothetical protein
VTSRPHSGPEGPGGDDDTATTAIPTAGGTDIAGAAQPADDRRAATAAVLDEPLDDGDLTSRVYRPGLARSTRILLALVVAVGLIALGAWIGRATSKPTGPGSMPDVVGTVESVGGGAEGAQLTVRAADGTLTVFTTTAGTKVATTRPNGLGGVRNGQQVTVSSERNRLGGTDATVVQLPAG